MRRRTITDPEGHEVIEAGGDWIEYRCEGTPYRYIPCRRPLQVWDTTRQQQKGWTRQPFRVIAEEFMLNYPALEDIVNCYHANCFCPEDASCAVSTMRSSVSSMPFRRAITP